MKYTKAPISELICGVVFHTNTLATNNALFELISELQSEYPILKTNPAIFEEELIGMTLQSSMDFEKSGFSMYRLFSKDEKWLVQLQYNFFSIHWIRKDEENTGDYPGFDAVYGRFENILEKVKMKFTSRNPKLNFQSAIKVFSLHYQDRIFINRSVKEGKLDNIFNTDLPFYGNTKSDIHFPNNIFCKFTIPCKDLNGYGIIGLNTGTSQSTGEPIFVLENKIKGKFDDTKEWFNKAHSVQLAFFENFFKKETLESWK